MSERVRVSLLKSLSFAGGLLARFVTAKKLQKG
jgi:hypothetical protein